MRDVYFGFHAIRCAHNGLSRILDPSLRLRTHKKADCASTISVLGYVQQRIAFPTPSSIRLFGIVQDTERFMGPSADAAYDRLFIRLHPMQAVRTVKDLVSSSVQTRLSQH